MNINFYNAPTDQVVDLLNSMYNKHTIQAAPGTSGAFTFRPPKRMGVALMMEALEEYLWAEGFTFREISPTEVELISRPE